MASPILPDADRVSSFSVEDRVMHTTKYAERTFGAPLADIGTVEVDGNLTPLIVTVYGVAHKLNWARQQNGSILWFADDETMPIQPGPSDRALARLRAHLASA